VTTRRQTDNLLGALALSVVDRISSVADGAGHSMTAATALSAMAGFLDGASIDRLRDVLGLSHSGAVRLVDRLVADGLARRLPGPDGRSRSVTLTTEGREAAARIAAEREALLHRLTGALDARERSQLQQLLAKMLAEVVATKDGGAWVCRLCDLGACGRGDGKCPTARAAAVKYGPSAVSSPAGRTGCRAAGPAGPVPLDGAGTGLRRRRR
jgi:DNA-binding MarR family transcriptional regulator